MINPMKNINLIFLISAIVAFSFSSSRVSFSRPNSIYKTPGSYFPDLGEGRISLGFSSEIIDLEVPSNSSSAFINAKIKKWNFGLSYTLLPDYRSLNAIALEPLSESPYEVGMHLQRRIYGYKSLYIDVGVHDLSIKNINSNKGLFDDASLFFVVSNNKKFNGYDMAINYGFGTGKLGSDYHNYDDDSGPSMSPFLSILLNTPYFNNKMNLIFEYDGQGLNLGSQIPITEIYSLRFGITHINKITEWAKRAEENNQDFILENDAPAIMFGFVMNIPDVQSDRERIKNQLLSPEGNLYEDIQPLVIIDSSRIKAQEIEILNYKDSLQTAQAAINILDNENAHIRKNIAILEDSTKKMLLNIEIEKSKRNSAMRQFQKSHDLLIEKKYNEALDMIDAVIELQPDLAIAYARRGTIYYYLNDTKAASMNWNIALKLDPEYDQVREILKGLKEGTVQPLYKDNTNNEE
tara:strand:- start:1029 stop:2420 length:1392 start_codon:yes stop_codon:yes gene_type:complete